MMYHNSPDGPRPCKAKDLTRCPYGRAGQPHFETQIEAQKHYESEMKKQYGVVPMMSRVDKARARFYRFNDQNRALGKFLKQPSAYNLQKYAQLKKVTKAMNKRDVSRRRKRQRSFANRLVTAPIRIPARILTRHTKKVVKRTLKRPSKLLLTKYWMPNIHSKKWR